MSVDAPLAGKTTDEISELHASGKPVPEAVVKHLLPKKYATVQESPEIASVKAGESNVFDFKLADCAASGVACYGSATAHRMNLRYSCKHRIACDCRLCLVYSRHSSHRGLSRLGIWSPRTGRHSTSNEPR